jgi:hypothetical protein
MVGIGPIPLIASVVGLEKLKIVLGYDLGFGI